MRTISRPHYSVIIALVISNAAVFVAAVMLASPAFGRSMGIVMSVRDMAKVQQANAGLGV